MTTKPPKILVKRGDDFRLDMTIQDLNNDAAIASKAAMDAAQAAYDAAAKLHEYVENLEAFQERDAREIELLQGQLEAIREDRDAWKDQSQNPLLSDFAKAISDHRESLPAEIWNYIDALQKQIDFSANGKFGPVYSGPMVDAAFRRAEEADSERDAFRARVAELEAERERDHAEINLKADVIERMINQSAADYERLAKLEEIVRGFANQSNWSSTATELFIWDGDFSPIFLARAALSKEPTT